ncbi:MAG: DUF6531 domain-containing protein, partial [Coraliomargarita sp.]
MKLPKHYCTCLVVYLYGVHCFAQQWVYQPDIDYSKPENQTLEVLQGSPGFPSASAMELSASNVPLVSSVSGIADAIFPEINHLANALGNDPVKIAEFVINSISYEHYYGSKRGARLTLFDGIGNDYDQASLLVSLCRAAGYNAGYATEWTIVYYQHEDPDVPTAISWLGLPEQPLAELVLDPNAEAERLALGWSVEQYKQVLALKSFCERGGFEPLVFSSFPGAVLIKRTVAIVETSPGLASRIDPAAKTTVRRTKMDLLSATGFQKNAFLEAIGGTSGSNYIMGIDEAALQAEFSKLTNAVIDSIRATHSNASVDEVLGVKKPTQVKLSSSADVPFRTAVVNSAPYTTEYYAQVPTAVMSKLVLQLNSTSEYSIPMAKLAGQRLSVTHAGTTVKFWLEDSLLFQRTVSANTYDLKMEARHPHFRSATQADVDAGHATTLGEPIARNDGSTVNDYKRGDGIAYALIYGFTTSQRYFRYRNKVLDGILAEIRALDATLFDDEGALDFSRLTDAALKRKVVTELLNVMGINWLYQTELANQMVASLTENNLITMHRFGRMAQEQGFFVDVGLQGAIGFTGQVGAVAGQRYAIVTSYAMSALEHGIIDQYEFESNAAVSTIQIVHLANASTDSRKNRIYYADASNWSSVSSALNGYDSSDLAAFQGLVNEGTKLILPRHKNNGSPDWDWNGSGYIELLDNGSGGLSIGMKITGDFETSGGWNTRNSFVNPAPIYRTNIATPNYSNYSGASTISLPSTPSWNRPRHHSWDPVDMASGAFVFDRADLTLGGTGVRGLSFSRHYNSHRNNLNSADLGLGWTHNYDMRASIRTAPEAGLGETTTYECAPMLAAVTVIAELVDDPENLREMVAGALFAKCAVDNLLNNALTVTLGKEQIQFIRLPDGSFVAPAGSTLSLTESDDQWVMRERFGHTWTFDRSENGRISSIEDPFGQVQHFSYDANEKLKTVTDADARTLSFNYTNDKISSVSDSTGRTVGFQYSADEALTHATGPEGKTARFYYDSEQRLNELRDPDDRIIVQNQYDSEGRVERQISEGDAAKVWDLAFSGYENTETDPFGGTKTYRYDQRGRAIATVNEAGETTHTEFDGHDHIVLGLRPGALQTRSLYDAQQNLRIQSAAPDDVIDGFILDGSGGYAGVHFVAGAVPEGRLSSYTYDDQHRITELRIKDLTGAEADRVTTYSYDASNTTNLVNSLVDPEGNETRFTYYPDGQVHTRTRVSASGNRTSTYSYDALGMPQRIDYPDGTSEHFVYNARGDLSAQTNRRGKTTSYQYNARRQLTQTTHPDA